MPGALLSKRRHVHQKGTHQMLSDPSANHFGVIDRLSHLRLLLRQRYIVSSLVLLEVFHLLGTWDRENFRPLVHHPGERQLAQVQFFLSAIFCNTFTSSKFLSKFSLLEKRGMMRRKSSLRMSSMNLY